MTNTREEVAVAEAITNAGLEWHSNIPEASAMDFLSDRQAKAAIAASNSKYVAGVVEALKHYREQEWLGGEDGVAAQALNNLPDELKL